MPFWTEGHSNPTDRHHGKCKCEPDMLECTKSKSYRGRQILDFFLFVCFVLMILLNKFQFWVYSMHSKCMIVFVRSSQTYNKKVWSSSKYIISLVRTVSINAFYPHMLCILIITVYFAKNNDFSMAMIFQYLQLDLALICPPLKEFDKM